MFQKIFANNLADRDTVKKRNAECESCEHRNIFKVCEKCGCITNMKTKLKNEKCPIGKW